MKSSIPSFQFFPHQKDDLARAALRDGAIIAWDPGLGKTFAAFTWPILKKSRRCLIVAPASLHKQIMDEGRKFFGVNVQTIRSQTHYHSLVALGKLPANISNDPLINQPINQSTSQPDNHPENFITDYRWLG